MIAINDLKKRKIAILGTGLDSVKCTYYLHRNEIFIKYFLNNNSMIESFMGNPVYDLGNKNLSNVDYIIIAVGTISTYLELSEQLQKKGMKEFKDYIYYKWIEKEIVLLHGNCHMIVIRSYLESSKKFSERYAIYPNPCICDNKDGFIKDHVYKNCDIWIHEDIRKDNEFGYYLSDEFMRECFFNMHIYPKEIIIPHLFGLGKAFFPQSDKNKRNEKINNGYDKNGMFPHADKVIDECVNQGMKIEEIIEHCKSNTVLSDDIILKNFNKYIKKIKLREKSWNIKIYDFIIDNYQKEKLFYDEGHPTNIIMKKISIDILNELGIQEENIYTNIKMDDHENPVYPVVKHVLNLAWEERNIRESPAAKKMCDQMNFDEYIKEYLLWNYRINT